MWIIIRLLIGIAILLIVEFYFVKRLNLAVKQFFPKFYENKFRLVRRIYLVWVNLYPLVLLFIFTYFAVTGSYLSSPENKIIDYFLIYPFWINFLLMIQCALFFIPLDILKLFSLLFPKINKLSTNRIHSVLLFLIIGFFLFYVPIRVIYDYNSVSVRTVEYQKENLPPSLENFRIVFISDIQADHYTDKGRLSNYLNKVNSLNPDLILIAGDLITTGPDYIELSAREVGKLKAKYGVYSCVGDHDNWAYRNDYERSLTEVKSALNYNGVQMIDNDIRIINVNGADVAITFITATYVEDVPKVVLDSLSTNNYGDFKIFLAHQPQPEIIETARKNNFDLFLAGHTHGGQITFVFPFVQLTPTMFETSYTRGDFWFDSMLMIVSRGLGMSLAPIRYNSTPEITLIVLKSER
ncbi:MAG: metallophosphoesterase [Ignavibacteriaceae bacterium]|nr:metallophosphoesterase [Ignavibacteriaceae bacterium]